MASKRSIFTKVTATMIAVMLAACEFPASGQSATSVVSPSSSVSTMNTSETSSTEVTEVVASTVSSSAISTTATSAAPTSNSGGCASLTGQQALEKYIDRVGLPFPAEPAGPDNRWSMNSPTDTYDPCKDLSWIVLEIDRATGSSPDQVMFFNHGVYIGQAAEEAFDFSPEVTRIKRDLVQVVMNVIAPGEPTAGYTTSVVSVYGWNDETNRFEHYGPLPANVRTDAYEYFP